MKKLELMNNIWWIGAIDEKLRVFDIIMETEFGTTYNSYLVKGSEKIALIETVKHTFTEEYIAKLQEEINFQDINYIVVDHTEPDHAGTVEALLKLAPNAIVVGSEPAIQFMAEIANREIPSIVVKDGDTISLGDKTLQFIMAPFLHWPDSIYTYCMEDKVLFTCDSFGAHYAFDDILLSKVTKKSDYQKALRYYFDVIFGPFKKYMQEAIAKIEPLEIEMICPGHGPVLDQSPWEAVKLSKEWSKPEEKGDVSVVIPYVSAYGYTGELAEIIKNGVEAAGPIKTKLFDMVTADQGEVYKAMNHADGLLFGTPTINSDALLPIMDLLIHLSPIEHGNKWASAFGSYGWSGEGVGNVTRRLTELRMQVIEGYRVRFKPSPEELMSAYGFGKQFGRFVLGLDQYVPVISEENSEEYNGTEVKLWRCVVCGEIFEGVTPPNICPACGATKEQFEVYVKDEVYPQFTDQRSIVVLGGGIAGISAIEGIRKRNQLAKITLVDKEGLNIYYKPMLSDFISNDDVQNEIFLHPVEWYADNNIAYKRGVEALKIDPVNKKVQLSNQEELIFDELIIATGSYSFVPPVQNATLPGVFTIRTMTDAVHVKKQAKDSKKAVIIGGGLLGLEAADQLNQMGIEVTVIEAMERILPRQLDSSGAAILERGILRTGIQLIKGCSVSELVGSDKVRGVVLSSGIKLNADLVIISAGIRAELKVAKEAGILCNRGIVVDKQMKTNFPNIYAAGDVAEVEGIAYGIWPEAVKQGNIAGANSVGDEVLFTQEVPSSVFNGMNMNVFSIGDVNPSDLTDISTLLIDDHTKEVYKRLIFRNNRLIGAILIGDNKNTKACIDGIRDGYTYEQMIKYLVK